MTKVTYKFMDNHTKEYETREFYLASAARDWIASEPNLIVITIENSYDWN